MWPFSLIREWREATVKLRLAAAEVDERITALAAPIKHGASDTQIQASIALLNDLTQTVKMGTGTVRMKGNGK
jgi:hypothetical protein